MLWFPKVLPEVPSRPLLPMLSVQHRSSEMSPNDLGTLPEVLRPVPGPVACCGLLLSGGVSFCCELLMSLGSF